MARVYVGIGSNVDRARNVLAGIGALREAFGPLALSAVYESAAVGFASDNFYNLVAGFDTQAVPEAVAATLRDIEQRHGRERGGPRYAPRTLDIDLIAYDDVTLDTPELTLPHPRLFERAFVLAPLAEIVPDRAIGDVRIRDALAKLDQTGIEKLPPR